MRRHQDLQLSCCQNLLCEPFNVDRERTELYIGGLIIERIVTFLVNDKDMRVAEKRSVAKCYAQIRWITILSCLLCAGLALVFLLMLAAKRYARFPAARPGALERPLGR